MEDKNNLEQFIKNNRNQFDDKMPDSALWQKIDQQLPKQKQEGIVISFKAMRMAASFFLILTAGIWIGSQYSAQNPKLDYTATPELRQFRETEAYYNTLVNQKLNQLQDPVTKTNVQSDMKQLDDIYQEIRKEMLSNEYANSQILIDAMIKNYKTKVDILENILNKQNQNEYQSISL
jgi:antirestriction protein ArdC